jgi:hypothetical protein
MPQKRWVNPSTITETCCQQGDDTEATLAAQVKLAANCATGVS